MSVDDTRYFSACESSAELLAKNSDWPCKRLSWVKKQIARHRQDLRALRHHSDAGDTRRSKQRRRQILDSFAGRLCGELFQSHRHRKKTGKLVSLPWECLEMHIQRSPLKTGKADQVILFTQHKNDGGRRLICNPGPRVRAAQSLVSRVISASGHANPYDCNSLGEGHHAAVTQVSKLLLSEGLTHVVAFDIEQCFPSVRPGHLNFLELPKEVIKSCICFADNAHLTISHTNGEETKMARQGLPQGAPASAQIASALLGRELRHIGGDNGTVTYIDDGVIGASSFAEADQVAKALKKRLATHPGGPIGLKRLEICEATQGFAFLSYWVQLRTIGGEPYVTCSPSHSAKTRARRRLFGRLRQESSYLDFDQAVERMQLYLQNWRRSFPLWKPTQEDAWALGDEWLSWVDDYLSGFTKKQQPLLSKVQSS